MYDFVRSACKKCMEKYLSSPRARTREKGEKEVMRYKLCRE
jgi:hypothetical protein